MRSAGWLIAGCCGALLMLALPDGQVYTQGQSQTATASSSTQTSPEQAARVACAGCHAFPPADILPKAAWRDEVVKMHFIREKRLPPQGSMSAAAKATQLPADFEAALAFYLGGAPERLPTPEAWPPVSESPRTFTRRRFSMADMPGPPAVSHVTLIDLDGDKQLDIIGTDMRHGVVFAMRSSGRTDALSTIASIPNPSHVSVADVDRDGFQDLLVSDLGEFFPADHKKGAAIWLRGSTSGKYSAFWFDGWPRVASSASADFNGDGKDDVLVAAFGWRMAGEVAILENKTTNPTRPDFGKRTIDPRTGSIDVVPVDLNRDGKMDFVTLLAQEHEVVLAYINRGSNDFAFEQKVIYAAPHPNWGSSGLQLVDLDKDRDLDVLLTHGDTFDDGLVKPYHGIQWLENTGNYPYVARTLATMPGVHSARATDLDGDGDLDIVAAALLAGGSDVDEAVLPALAWLEQTKPGTFVRHTIEMGFPRHASLDVGDIDSDGDVDIVVGSFSIDKTPTPSVDIWVNAAKK